MSTAHTAAAGPVPARAPSPFVRRLDELINASEKTQRQIAFELGYEKPNIITMFKQGSTRVPLEKVPRLAFVLNEDKAALTRLWLQTYEPQILSTLDETVGPMLSASERAWLKRIRDTFEGRVPPFDEGAAHRLVAGRPKKGR